MDPDDRFTRLEEKLTHLESHVSEQDKVILGLRDELDRLRRELVAANARLESMQSPDNLPIDERPPHY